MSARLLAAALCAGLLTVGRAAPVRAAADSVLVRVGGDLSARQYQTVSVPITVDLSGAAGRALGSYRATLSFNPAVLEFSGVENGSFAAPQFNTAHASDSGKVLLTAIQPSGATGTVVLFNAKFYVLDTLQSAVTIAFDEMSATSLSVTPFESLLPLLRIVNGTFCKSLGLWGDANGDGQANSLDALVALSFVVGIPMDTMLIKPALDDVDGDGRVTSRDALIILSYAVGLPVPGYRVLLTAPGACGTGSAITVTIAPDSLELQVGQTAFVHFDARDASGRSVAVDSGSVTSSDPSIAAYVPGIEGPDFVQARAPGVATLTAQIGPGVAGTFKVVVLARRAKWYVDVERARLAVAQTGSQNLPMEFIGDALALAHNGDTVLVASGTYEELISAGVAVVLLGDPLNRPVLDPRGAPSWYATDYALDLEPYTGLIELAHLDIRAGQTLLHAHDVVIRDVLIEGLNTQGTGLDIYSENLTPSPAPRPSGPMRSSTPMALGNVLLDGVVVSADSLTDGIVVEQADSVLIRNSTVTRAQPGTNTECGLGAYTSTGILVRQASVSVAQGNSVTNPVCQGIGLFDTENQTLVSDISRVTLSRNHVTGAPGTGIGVAARLVSLDHNVVRGTGLVPGQISYGYSAGVRVTSSYSCECSTGATPDSIVSLGDSIVNSGGRGLAVDTALAVVIDSLVVSGTGLDSSGSAPGVNLTRGGTYWLSHSQISNAIHSPGVFFDGDHTVLHSHGNHIAGSGQEGITVYQSCYSCAPPARSGPALAPGPQRIGPYSGGPDTLISVSDTIVGSGSDGIYSQYGAYTLVDSAVVDSAGSAGVYLQYLGRATVSHSMVRRTNTGINAYYVDSLTLLGDTAQSNGTGLYVYNYLSPDSTRIIRSTFAGNSGNGIYLYYANARVDSSVMVNNGTGLYVDYGGGARVRWTRFQANNLGMVMGAGSSSSSVVGSNFLSDTLAGAQNNAVGPTLTADTNYWGDSNGPRCVPIVGCSGSSVTGDSINSPSVTFANWLSASAPTLVPPTRLASVASRPARGAQAATATVSLPPRPPAPKNATRESVAALQSPHERPAAWHGPSKARTHALQVIVKKRT